MQLFANNAATKLSASVLDTDTTISVTDASVFPTLGAGDWFLVTLYQETGGVESNHEIVKVTAVATNDLTVERAQEGTTAGTFAIGDSCQLRLTAESAARFRDNVIFDGTTSSSYVIAADSGIPYLKEQ